MKALGLRPDFPALGQEHNGRALVYLDSAATALKPQSVVDCISHYYSTNGANIHRGKHWLSELASDAYESARVVMADFIRAAASEVVFTKNTTEAINVIANGLDLGKDDEVLGALDAHHSHILPWRRAATLRVARVDDKGRLDVDHFRDLLVERRPRVVALTHCSNVTGVLHPLELLIKEVRSLTDAVIVVDAAQSAPHRAVDVRRLDADFVVFSPHKMLAPSGVGCLYGRSEKLEALQPLLVGGGMVDLVEADAYFERRSPHKFEAGTPDIGAVLACAPAVAYLQAIDRVRLHDHERALTAALVEGAIARDYLQLVGPSTLADRQPIATFAFRNAAKHGSTAGEVSRLLSDSYGIMCRSGHLCAHPFISVTAGAETLRASAYIYNEVGEIENFFAALDELAQWTGLIT